MLTSMRQALVLPLKERFLLAVALYFAEAFANVPILLNQNRSISWFSELNL